MMVSISSIAQEKDVETIYTDGKNVVSTVYNDIKSLSPKVETAVKSLAEQFKTTTTELWNILVKQQLVWSICILLCLITTIFSWLHFWYRFKVACENKWGMSGSAHYELICIMCAAISIAGTIIVSINFNDMLTGFINPEYGALKTIVEVTTKLK